MAKTFTWPDGSKNHTISWADHQAHLQAANPGGTVSVNGRVIDQAAWERGDFLAGLTSPQYAAQQGFPDATTNPNAFTPYQPPPIPSGYFDPALDAQREAASRGLVNLEQDVGKGLRRSGEDYGLAVGGIERGYQRDTSDLATGYGRDTADLNLGYGRDTADLTLGRDRGLQDIGTARTNEGVDYGRNVEMLTRQYGQLGRQQAEQSRKYGVTSGGIALLSAAKRNENMGLERRDMDTTHQRNVAGFDTGEQRLGQDFTLSSGRLGEDFARNSGRLGEDYARTTGRLGEDRTLQLGQAQQTYDRGVADYGDTLSRARSEDVFYGADVNTQKAYQAQQAGYDAPAGPSNQKLLPDGRMAREVRQGDFLVTYDQTGRVVSRKRVAAAKPQVRTITTNLTGGRP